MQNNLSKIISMIRRIISYPFLIAGLILIGIWWIIFEDYGEPNAKD